MSNYAGEFVSDAVNNPWNKCFDLVKTGATVLDVGCSTGNFGAALIRYKDCIVDGVEPDAEDARKASKQLRKVVTSFVEDALEGELKNEKYDHIVFLDVIEHLYDPVATLKLLHKHLKPNGTVLFSIPNMAHVSTRIMLLSGDFEYGETGLLDKTHLHFYTKDEIDRVFTEAGYSIDTLTHTEATYSEDIVRAELSKVGVKNPSQDLISVLTQESASIFQFVGSATYKAGATKKITRKQYSPDPQTSITAWYEQHSKDLIKEIRVKNKKVEDFRTELIELRDRVVVLDNILSDKAQIVKRTSLREYVYWYVRLKIGSLKRRITRK